MFQEKVFVSKKAQGLSLNMLILIVLGVIVLLVALFLFTKQASTLSDNTAVDSYCIKSGGICKSNCAPNKEISSAPKSGWSDCSAGNKCCSLV